MTSSDLAAAGVEQTVPLLGVHSMDASLRFYVDGLGFIRTKQWIDDGVMRWCWLQHGGAALMLQEYTKESRPPAGTKLGLGIGLNFTCKDALAFYHGVRSRGITTKRPFVGNNMWVVSLTDPDGYQLHFESDTDAPEESEYDG